ncbi:hypothetical protein MTsPCn5_22100 [Croceitalea sp. MTPC5]|nr:hypothetical protein MTsPCn5_22100 [Croceitalea sp. MTPC5]
MDPSSKNNTQTHISRCLKRIEEQLGWGDSSQWSSRDFDRLGDKIHEQTGVNISNNTLKRLWGRIPYQSNPSTATLDTLSQFIGFENWSAFVAHGSRLKSAEPKQLNEVVKKPAVKRGLQKKMIIAATLIGCVLVVLAVVPFSGRTIGTPDYIFIPKKIANGLPNSVLFSIDASYAGENDKIEIQQNWDRRRRQLINRKDSLVASLYYTPGYFDAKLVVNDIVVKEHPLMIPSNGWMATLETGAAPVYFDPSEFKTVDGVAISPDLIKKRNTGIPITETFVNYFWVEDFKGLALNDFVMETTLRNVSFDTNISCQKTHIIILCEGEVVIIPLSIKGCIADLELYYLDRAITGSRNDLSNFGVDDFNNWATVKCVSKNNNFSIYVNDNLAYEIPTKGEDNKIYGVKYHFQGTGAISQLKLSNSGKIFLNE